MTTAPTTELDKITANLVATYGWIIGSADLSKVLGYRTASAFKKAASRQTLPVKTFGLEGRRGRFAKSGDVAAWLVSVGSGVRGTGSDAGGGTP